jgi:hypothetical protein
MAGMAFSETFGIIPAFGPGCGAVAVSGPAGKMRAVGARTH